MLENRKQLSNDFSEEMAEPLIEKGDNVNYGTHIDGKQSAQMVQTTDGVGINFGADEIDHDMVMARQLHSKINGGTTAGSSSDR